MHSCKTQTAKHILSFGGGVNSTALLVLLLEENYPLDEVVFADTGAEVPETYEYLKRIRAYAKKNGKRFRVVRSRNGTLLETCRKRRVIPSQIWRWSTRDYKITPIHAYYRSLGAHIHQYLGLAYDEVERVKDARVPYVTNFYPLIDERLTREDCLRTIKDAGLPVPVKSGCFFCPFNSISRWHEIYQSHPRLYSYAMQLEEDSKHFPKQKLTPTTLRELKARLTNGVELLPLIKIESPCGSECFT